MGLKRALHNIPSPEPDAPRRILVVDDSRLQRNILCRMMKRWGFDVSEAASGVEALAICREHPPDFVISDWMMPEMNGIEFCHEFREMPRNGYGYFILLTSKSEKDEIAQGLDAGADDFLTKPVNSDELRARVAAGERIIRMERELSDKNRLLNDTLNELQKLYDSIDGDLLEARKLQQSLVRDQHRDFGRAQVSLLLHSSGHVGGDLVGMFQAGEGHIGVYGLDVSGHGISSALLTARLAGYLSATAPDQNIALVRSPDGSFVPRRPDKTIAILNELILGELETEHYFTMLLADVNLETGKTVMAQAGHPFPAIQRSTGKVEFPGTGGLPVGLVEAAQYECFETVLHPGDRIMIYSDGITECDRSGGTEDQISRRSG